MIESLVFAGAFDSLGYTRGGMVQQVGEQPAFEKVSAPIIAERKAEAAGQFSLFGGSSDGPAIAEVDDRRCSKGPSSTSGCSCPRRRRCSASS